MRVEGDSAAIIKIIHTFYQLSLFRRKFLFIFALALAIPITGISKSIPKANMNNKLENLFNNIENSIDECIMLIHGFGGSPIDLDPLTRDLDYMGKDYYTVKLAGHGTHPRDLKNVQHETWINDCFEIYDSLASEYNSIVLIGFSMGGAISQLIASRRDVSKLIVLSPYFRIHQKWYYFGKPEIWAKRFSYILPYIKKLKIGQINDPAGLNKYDAYERIPLKAVGELVKVGEKTLREGINIKCPLLWLHSKRDIVSDFYLSRETFDRIESTNKEFIEYTKSNHILLYDYDSDDVIEQILAFLY